MKKLRYLSEAFALSVVLCSCASVPDNIFDNAESASQTEIGPPSPTAEVLKNAKDELAALADINGIFKLDNARLILPETDEIYCFISETTVNTPREALEKYRVLCGVLTDGGVFPNDGLVFASMRPGYPDLTAEEYLSQDSIEYWIQDGGNDPLSSFYYGGTFYGLSAFDANTRDKVTEAHRAKDEYFSDVMRLKSPPVEVIDIINADEKTLAREIDLFYGKTTVGGLVENMKNYANKLPCYDENYSFDVRELCLFSCGEGKYAVSADVYCFYGGIPLSEISCAASDHPFIKRKRVDLTYIRPERPELSYFYGVNAAYKKQGGRITEILPLRAAFNIMKNELSGVIVYEVSDISFCLSETEETCERDGIKLIPVWNIRCITGSAAYSVDINAVTGELTLNELLYPVYY